MGRLLNFPHSSAEAAAATFSLLLQIASASGAHDNRGCFFFAKGSYFVKALLGGQQSALSDEKGGILLLPLCMEKYVKG